MECSICLDSLLEECNSKGCSATQCGHIFHQKCLAKWLETHRSCPKCRKTVFAYQLRQIYLEGSDTASETNKKSRQEIEGLERNCEWANKQIKILNDELRVAKRESSANIKSLTKACDEANEKIERLTREVATLKEEVEMHRQKELASRLLQAEPDLISFDPLDDDDTLVWLKPEIQPLEKNKIFKDESILLRGTRQEYSAEMKSLAEARVKANDKIRRLANVPETLRRDGVTAYDQKGLSSISDESKELLGDHSSLNDEMNLLNHLKNRYDIMEYQNSVLLKGSCNWWGTY